jgi:hypothetical protein
MAQDQAGSTFIIKIRIAHACRAQAALAARIYLIIRNHVVLPIAILVYAITANLLARRPGNSTAYSACLVLSAHVRPFGMAFPQTYAAHASQFRPILIH